MKKQNAIVLEQMLSGGIDAVDAFKVHYIGRLASRVHDLRQLGVEVVSEPVLKNNSRRPYHRYYVPHGHKTEARKILKKLR